MNMIMVVVVTMVIKVGVRTEEDGPVAVIATVTAPSWPGMVETGQDQVPVLLVTEILTNGMRTKDIKLANRGNLTIHQRYPVSWI